MRLASVARGATSTTCGTGDACVVAGATRAGGAFVAGAGSVREDGATVCSVAGAIFCSAGRGAATGMVTPAAGSIAFVSTGVAGVTAPPAWLGWLGGVLAAGT